MKNHKLLLSIVLTAHFAVFASGQTPEDVYARLSQKLTKYSVERANYNAADYPILTGNTEIGGLADPLGRGVFNIEMANLYLDSVNRIAGPGMMLRMAQFAGLTPKSYRQFYSLETGLLSTSVEYDNGGYRSEMFFSHDDKELLVYSLQNTGRAALLCNIDLGRFALNPTHRTDTTIYAVSPAGAFTPLHYFLQSNRPLSPFYFPNTTDVMVNVPAGEKLEIALRLQTGERDMQQIFGVSQLFNMPQLFKQISNRVKDNINIKQLLEQAGVHVEDDINIMNLTEIAMQMQASITPQPIDLNIRRLTENHIQKWKENWRSMGVVLLPDGEYARAFYRSLHWLQCVAGSERHLPGECQFGLFTSAAAEAYGYRNMRHVNGGAWNQNPFTYGAAGWAVQAYCLLGNERQAAKMLTNFYQPEILTKNVTAMFPAGKHEYVYNGKREGVYDYLTGDYSGAYSFAHEQNCDGRSRGGAPWEQQVHVQSFGPSLFYRYNALFGENADTTYDVMRGSAEFWSSLLNYDASRKTYSVPPLLSLSEDLFEADLLDALLSAKWTLTEAARLAGQQNRDGELRKKWLHIAQNIRIKNRDDVYLEFAGDNGSRAGAGYFGVRGYAYLGFPLIEQRREFSARKVNKSLDLSWKRNKEGEGMITFIANWFALTDAYWGRAEEAYAKSAYCLTQIDRSGTAMCEQNEALYYFLTGYASFVIVPVAMALQSSGDEIKVFPAVPKAFTDMEFYDLPATGNIRVSGIMKGGKTQTVWFERNGKRLLETSGKDRVSVVVRGDKLVLK